MSTVNLKNKGLVKKYNVERTDGKPIKHGCIVLEFGDEIAHKAIEQWAISMRDAGYSKVYLDVTDKLAEIK